MRVISGNRSGKAWPQERRDKMSAHGTRRAQEDAAYQETFRKAREMMHNDPRLSPTETHMFAKYWEVIAPDGRLYTFRNLQHFCRQMEEQFGVDAIKLAGSLMNRKQHYKKDSTYPRTAYKGFWLNGWGE